MFPPDAPLPALNLAHLRALTDDTGLLQHAIFSIPRREEGYCVDDNARALILATLLAEDGSGTAADLAPRYLAFVQHAFNPRHGRFRNFRSYGRAWLEEAGSEDSHGRTLWALGTVAGRSPDPEHRMLAAQLFQAALPAVTGFAYPRSWAYTLLGLDEVLRSRGACGDLEACANLLAERLLDLYRRHRDDAWRWFEDEVTYCNARLPHALLRQGHRTGRAELVAIGLEALAWLCGVQTGPDGHFAPVGSDGFYPRGGARAAFDQQPVEACATLSACLEAWAINGEASWLAQALSAFAWYQGANPLGLPLADPGGGCRDGLERHGRNENQGAEATLSYLLSLVELGRAERDGYRAPSRPVESTRGRG